MLRSRTARVTTIAVGFCVVLALGCGLLGLAVRQGMITPRSVKVELGPLIFITRGPRSAACPQPGDPTSNLCERLSTAPRPAIYRIWLFWYTRGRGTQSTRVLFQWALPLRDESRGQSPGAR